MAISYMTAEGLQKLKDELVYLEGVERRVRCRQRRTRQTRIEDCFAQREDYGCPYD